MVLTDPSADGATLPRMDVAGRRARLDEPMRAACCDALLVTDLTNIRYLTGFTGSNAQLLVLPDRLYFTTDGRYTDQATEQLEAAGVEAEIAVERDPWPLVREAAKGVFRIGLEAGSLTWATQRKIAFDVFPWAHLVPTTGLVEEVRGVKDDGEIARLQQACRIADDSLAAVRHLVHEGVTELGFARALEDEMAARGSEAPSFETIVGSGPNGAKPHMRPTQRVIGSSGAGELVVVDFGATVDGYHSDMTRTLVVGELSDTQQRMFDVVAEAQAAGRATVEAGVDASAVDAACRDVIVEAGWEDEFLHSTGHGIGLVIHEEPRVSSQSSTELVAGHCITVEPGVYLADHGGVRIEDSLAVTDDGHTVLTGAPYR